MSGDVTTADEIGYIMRELIRTKELLNASFNNGRDSMPTLLLEADQRRDVLTFDGSSDAAVNRGIVSASRVTLSGSLRGAKIEFISVGAREISYHGATAIALPFPRAVKRFQNREAFRVKTTNVTCNLPVPGRGYVTVQVQEMSVGGALFMLDYASDSFQLGQKTDCQLKLGSAGTIRCNVEVRGFKRVGRQLGMGCRFVGLSRADETAIARFISQEERGSIKKSGFFGL